MARSKKKTTKRGSPEAIAKRRAARALNQLFAASSTGGAMDGRTLKRKNRLTAELKTGRDGRALKAIEVLTHATELLALGETLTSLRKLKPLLPPTPSLDVETAQVVADTQANYGFDAHAWKLLGITIEQPEAEKSVAPATKKASPRKKAAPKRRPSKRS